MPLFFCDLRSVLKEFMSPEEFVTADVPILMKAGIGCNRDAVGWALVGAAAGHGHGSCLNVYDHVQVQPVVCESPNTNYLGTVFQFPFNIEAQ